MFMFIAMNKIRLGNKGSCHPEIPNARVIECLLHLYKVTVTPGHDDRDNVLSDDDRISLWYRHEQSDRAIRHKYPVVEGRQGYPVWSGPEGGFPSGVDKPVPKGAGPRSSADAFRIILGCRSTSLQPPRRSGLRSGLIERSRSARTDTRSTRQRENATVLIRLWMQSTKPGFQGESPATSQGTGPGVIICPLNRRKAAGLCELYRVVRP